MTKLEEVALLKEQMRSLLSQAKTEKKSYRRRTGKI